MTVADQEGKESMPKRDKGKGKAEPFLPQIKGAAATAPAGHSAHVMTIAPAPPTMPLSNPPPRGGWGLWEVAPVVQPLGYYNPRVSTKKWAVPSTGYVGGEHLPPRLDPIQGHVHVDKLKNDDPNFEVAVGRMRAATKIQHWWRDVKVGRVGQLARMKKVHVLQLLSSLVPKTIPSIDINPYA